MKIFFICACLGIWSLDLALRSNHKVLVNAQNWNISQTYEPITFEWTHRGSFNLSYCTREMINCYEIFQLQTVCGYWYKSDSICAAMKRHCNDHYGDHTNYENYHLDINDGYCAYYWSDRWWT